MSEHVGPFTQAARAAWGGDPDLDLAALTMTVPDCGSRICVDHVKGMRNAMVRNTEIPVDTILTMIRFGIPMEAILWVGRSIGIEWEDLAACCWWAAHHDYCMYGIRKAVDMRSEISEDGERRNKREAKLLAFAVNNFCELHKLSLDDLPVKQREAITQGSPNITLTTLDNMGKDRNAPSLFLHLQKKKWTIA